MQLERTLWATLLLAKQVLHDAWEYILYLHTRTQERQNNVEGWSVHSIGSARIDGIWRIDNGNNDMSGDPYHYPSPCIGQTQQQEGTPHVETKKQEWGLVR